MPFDITDHQPEQLPQLYQRALIAREPPSTGKVALAQFVAPNTRPAFPPPGLPSIGSAGPVLEAPVAPVARGIKLSKRGDVRIQLSWFPSPDGSEQIAVINSGVNIVITGDPQLGPIDISTDRLVIWTPDIGADPLSGGSDDTSRRYELYMEGNIVFRQADRVIYANSLYYDVQQQAGTLIDAELLSPIPEYDGLVRIKAAVLRQDGSRIKANGAAITSSRLGVPSYWFQAGELTYEEVDQPFVDPISGSLLVDPLSGQPVTGKQRLAVSRNNSIFVAGWPVFFWPTLATDLTEPSVLVNEVILRNDNVFGSQFGIGLNLGRLFGLGARVPGVQWNGGVDYLSKRGWGLGTDLAYDLDRFLGIEGPTRGYFDAWGIDEQGTDNLGRDRRAGPGSRLSRSSPVATSSANTVRISDIRRSRCH